LPEESHILNWLQGSNAEAIRKLVVVLEKKIEEDRKQSCGAIFGTMGRAE